METATKPKFISKHKKLLASFFIVALAIASVAAYMRTEGVTVGSVTVKVDAQSPQPATTSVSPVPTLRENISANWQGNGTINVREFIIWLNATYMSQTCGSTIGDCSGIITAQQMNEFPLQILNNQTTVSPTLVTVNILGYSNGNSVISIVFIGNFHLQESWGVINTKQVDFTYASYGN